MSKGKAKPKIWTKPEVRRLGELKDVAGAAGTGTQGTGVSKS